MLEKSIYIQGVLERIEEILRGADSREDVLWRLRDWEVLGVGGKRVAIRASGGGVWKVPWQEEGERDNEIEWALWNRLPEIHHLLCPVLEKSGRCIRAEECLPLSPGEIGPEGRVVASELSRWGISDSAVNLGMLRGKIVSYDFSFISPELYKELFP